MKDFSKNCKPLIKLDILTFDVCSFHSTLVVIIDLPLNRILSRFQILSIVVFETKLCFIKATVFGLRSFSDTLILSERPIVFCCVNVFVIGVDGSCCSFLFSAIPKFSVRSIFNCLELCDLITFDCSIFVCVFKIDFWLS
ncbi:Uncharacterised protein [uncultured archaeon]|nr:Uncharacterised protein [uncultured archaeon]